MNYYKYYSANKLSLNTLRNNRIFFANPSLLNDSFDTSAKVIEAYPTFCKKIGWSAYGVENLDKHGVFSMTQGEIPNNRHLWSLYAGNFTGFAIEFRNDILELFANNHDLCITSVQYVDHPLDLDNQNSSFSIPERKEPYQYYISYCWSKGKVNIQISNDEYVVTGEKALERLFEYLHLQKDARIWQVEQEARIIIANSVPRQAKRLKTGYYMTLPQGCISKIYIGRYMENAYKKRLKKIAKRLMIEMYEAEPKVLNGTWDVQITKL